MGAWKVFRKKNNHIFTALQNNNAGRFILWTGVAYWHCSVHLQENLGIDMQKYTVMMSYQSEDDDVDVACCWLVFGWTTGVLRS